jgi:hypothetical protein
MSVRRALRTVSTPIRDATTDRSLTGGAMTI